MSANKKAGVTPGGRQAAYSARNRAALLKAGREVLAEIGPTATIEQLAAHAQVSPTTIYKYFENKDKLFVEALGEAWHNWVSWSFSQVSATDDLEVALEAARILFRAKETHPQIAQVLHNTLREMPDFAIRADEGIAKRVFGELASAGKISAENFDQRFTIWSNIYIGLLADVLATETLSPDDADVGLAIGLSVWGISEAKAKKLISRPLGFSPVPEH